MGKEPPKGSIRHKQWEEQQKAKKSKPISEFQRNMLDDVKSLEKQEITEEEVNGFLNDVKKYPELRKFVLDKIKKKKK